MTRRLERTDGPPLGVSGIEALVRAGGLEGVTELVLRDQAIGDEGLALVLGALDLSRLEELDLAGCDLYSEGAARLARASALTGLRVLDVAFDSLSAPAIVGLVSAPQFGALEELNLSMNAIDVRVAEALVAASLPETLVALTINDTTTLDDAFVTTLARRRWPKLAWLGLGWHRGVTDRSATALADASVFPALRRLVLEGCSIGEAGHAALHERALDELVIDPPYVDPYDADGDLEPDEGGPF